MNTIKLEIPRDPSIMKATADWLLNEMDKPQRKPYQTDVVEGAVKTINDAGETIPTPPVEEVTTPQVEPQTPVPTPPAEVTETPVPEVQGEELNLEAFVRIEGEQRFIGSLEVDINNLPHDNRIFTDNKTKVKDGSWRLKRANARQDHDVDIVTEQLKATLLANMKAENLIGGGEAPVTTDPEPTVPVAPVVTGEVPQPPASTAPVAPVGQVPAPPATNGQVPVPPAPVEEVQKKASGMSFPEAMAEFGSYQSAGKVTMQDIEAICLSHGVENIGLLSNAPAIIPTVIREVRAKAVAVG